MSPRTALFLLDQFQAQATELLWRALDGNMRHVTAPENDGEMAARRQWGFEQVRSCERAAYMMIVKV